MPTPIKTNPNCKHFISVTKAECETIKNSLNNTLNALFKESEKTDETLDKIEILIDIRNKFRNSQPKGNNHEEENMKFDCLAVTQCKVYPMVAFDNESKIRAIVEVVINDQLLIRNLRVMDGINGLYVGYPPDPFYKGENFRTICNPITRQFREHLENTILEKYQENIANDR